MAQRQFRSDDTSTWAEAYGDGSAGALTVSVDTTDSTANTTITGTSGATSATAGSGTGFAANDLVLIHQTQGTGHGNWELNKISSVGGGTNWTLSYSLTNTYVTGAQVYKLTQYSTVTINSTKTLTGQSWNGSKGGILAILANTSVTVTGTINNKGAVGQGGATDGTFPQVGGAIGGFRGGDLISGSPRNQGESGVGVGGAATTANGAGGGGSAGSNSSNGGEGGGGGHATSGSAGTSAGTGTGGSAGGTAGNTGLTSLELGAGGGAGQGNNTSDSNGGRAGSSGGGAVIIISPTMTVTGAINANGGSTSGVAFYTGGSGAGGSILIKGKTIDLGTSLVTANGGSGSPTGGAGRIHADYATSITGTTSPTIDTRQDASLNPVTSASGANPYSFFM